MLQLRGGLLFKLNQPGNLFGLLGGLLQRGWRFAVLHMPGGLLELGLFVVLHQLLFWHVRRRRRIVVRPLRAFGAPLPPKPARALKHTP